MSSIPSNPNSNPKCSVITNPSSSIPPTKPAEIKRKNSNRNNKRMRRMRSSKNKRSPNWLELPEDVWFVILSKLKTIDIIVNAHKVCMLFRKLCKRPSMFRTIDMDPPSTNDLYNNHYVFYSMIRYAVDCSAGQLVDIHLFHICNDETLMYIAERSPNLKHLRFAYYVHVSDDVLIEAVKKLPMLEEVQIILCAFAEETVEALGCALPTLRSFSLVHERPGRWGCVDDKQALRIAESMPYLRHLQLIGNSMSNDGLKAILKGCPLLESLDIRGCVNIVLSGDLGERCKLIENLRMPHESTKDYPFLADEEEDEEEDFDYDGPYQYLSCPALINFMNFKRMGSFDLASTIDL